jgi:hypothetical protein
MKSRILATTAANRRYPIVLLNFQINYFLPPQMRAKFPRFCAQTHVGFENPRVLVFGRYEEELKLRKLNDRIEMPVLFGTNQRSPRLYVTVTATATASEMSAKCHVTAEKARRNLLRPPRRFFVLPRRLFSLLHTQIKTPIH